MKSFEILGLKGAFINWKQNNSKEGMPRFQPAAAAENMGVLFAMACQRPSLVLQNKYVF